jgi:hypothetical protein
MEFLWIVAVVLVVYYLFNNKKSSHIQTRERHFERFDTEKGYVERETVMTDTTSTLDITKKKDFTPNNYVSPTGNVDHKRAEKVITHEHNNTPTLKNTTTAPTLTFQNAKQCSCCKKAKNSTEFFNSKKNADGLSKWCKECLEKGKIKGERGRYKVCPKCKKNRLVTSFFKGKQPDGLSKWCKMCHR